MTQGVDAIVINVDPAQVGAGLATGRRGRHSGRGDGRGLPPDVCRQHHLERLCHGRRDVRSMSPTGSAARARWGDVHLRPVPAGAGAAASSPTRVFANFPDIEVIDRITPDVIGRRHRRQPRADGGAAGRETLEPGSISAVWAAWDQPALGRAAGDRGRRTRGRGDRHHRHRRQPPGAGRDRGGRQFRGQRGADFEGIGSGHRRDRGASACGRGAAPAGDLRAPELVDGDECRGMRTGPGGASLPPDSVRDG